MTNKQYLETPASAGFSDAPHAAATRKYLAPFPWRLETPDCAISPWTDALAIVDAAGSVIAYTTRGYQDGPSFDNAGAIVDTLNAVARAASRETVGPGDARVRELEGNLFLRPKPDLVAALNEIRRQCAEYGGDDLIAYNIHEIAEEALRSSGESPASEFRRVGDLIDDLPSSYCGERLLEGTSIYIKVAPPMEQVIAQHIVGKMENLQFIECDTCRAKPGSPTLCAGCLNNRRVIDALKGRVQK